MKPDQDQPCTPRLYAEDENGSTVILQTRRNRTYGRRFTTMFTETTAALAKFDRPPVYYRALLHLTTVLDPIQPRRYSARELAEATGMAIASATRALAMLEADQVVFATGSTGAKARRLSRQLFSMSSSERWHEAQEEAADPEPVDARGR